MALNICRKMYRSWHTAGKDNAARHFSSVLTKTIFNILARTAKFKMTYVRVVYIHAYTAYRNSAALTGNYILNISKPLVKFNILFFSKKCIVISDR